MRLCKYCFREIKYNKASICYVCDDSMKRDDMQHYRVRLGEVGSNTIPYQQNLHYKFFSCNAPVKYRGIKEERIYNTLESEKVVIHSNILLKTISSFLPSNLLWLYNKVNHLKNFTKRLLYNAVLYHIDYHILHNNSYQSLNHMKVSMVQTLFNHIIRTYIRLNKDYKQNKIKYTRVQKAKTEKIQISNKSYEAIKDSLCKSCNDIIVSAYY